MGRGMRVEGEVLDNGDNSKNDEWVSEWVSEGGGRRVTTRKNIQYVRQEERLRVKGMIRTQ